MSDKQTCFANMTIADGLTGYYAAPKAEKAPGVVVMMEAFGLTRHIADVCDALAAAGFAAIAPDIYHGETYAYSDMEGIYAKIRSMNDDVVMSEVGQSLEYLSKQPGVDGSRLGIAGFCMGGRFAFLGASVHVEKIKAAVSFYGGGISPEGDKDQLGRTGPVAKAAAIKAPLLLIYGGKDSAIKPQEQGRIAQKLGELGKKYTLTVYPEGGHGFCCAERESYEPTSAKQAMQQAVEFLNHEFAA